MMSDSKVCSVAIVVVTASHVMSRKIHQALDMKLFFCLSLSHVMGGDSWELRVVEFSSCPDGT